MDDKPRLIEHAFPLRQASIDSVHEKNVRHGHISTLHIWPARRPLAACRAALIATLLPDPGTPEERKIILEKLGGRVINVQKKSTKDNSKTEKKYVEETLSGEILHVQKKTKKDNGKSEKKYVEETEGGILHWGRESNPDFAWFREEIRKAYGGRAPKVLDPFAGGGAIPLEAMRLGCDTTAIDINPVAWFILKCTLEYPQKLAGQRLPLPRFAIESPEFMEQYYKAMRKGAKKSGLPSKSIQSSLDISPEVDLAWHVRAWGWWVLQDVKKELEQYYPTIDGKPTVAFLSARTAICKNCRAIIPLLKTLWLCKTDKSRVLLTMKPNDTRTGVVFGIQNDVPIVGRTVAERRKYDKKIGTGTISRNGAWCPCCGKSGSITLTPNDLKYEGQMHRIQTQMTAVVVNGSNGKEFRVPLPREIQSKDKIIKNLNDIFLKIPFGLPNEPTPSVGSGASRAFSVQSFGMMHWSEIFSPQELLSLGTFLYYSRAVRDKINDEKYPDDWKEAIQSYLAIILDKLADRQSSLCRWDIGYSKINSTFTRFALPYLWDFCEGNPLSNTTGNYSSCIEWVAEVIEHSLKTTNSAPSPKVMNQSALMEINNKYDIILTDPPYYDAIPYSDLMDFFYIWLRRTLFENSDEIDAAFRQPLSPKWNHETNDGELIEDGNRFENNRDKSKISYENGMYRAFLTCHNSLLPNGRLVIVFANKQPDAWETLVSATIRAGFIVDGSWPIQTEMGNRSRAHGSAALSSSVWLVCKKRPETARPGWDTQVLEEMRKNIHVQLREFWDAGIRGPNFVWAATGPALEAYSKHPVVKKANEPGQVMTVSEFLHQVRRIVVDFVVGRVLSKDGNGSNEIGLDDVTTYYLLHRNDFGFEKAPTGACILYAVSCGLSDNSLAFEYDIVQRTGGKEAEMEEGEGEDEGEEDESTEGKGSTVSLKTWKQRKGKNLGIDINGRPAPMIDRIHRLMHLWRAGDESKVNDYLDRNGLWNNTTFHHLLQAIIEMSKEGDEERAMLESISNHIMAKGGASKGPKTLFAYERKDSDIRGEEKR